MKVCIFEFYFLHILLLLSLQPGILELLELFGYFPNRKGDYILTDAKSPQERAQRMEAAWEFRRFYDELKKIKDDQIGVLEYCIGVGLFSIK